MNSDIWDANGAIPMWGPAARQSSTMASSVIDTMDGEVGGQMDQQMDGPTDAWRDEPVDRAAVSAISQLSPREREVLQELVDGKSHDVAAQDLYISHHTFRTHVKNILTKLDAHSSIEAVSIAVCAGVRPSRMHDLEQSTGDASDHPRNGPVDH